MGHRTTLSQMKHVLRVVSDDFLLWREKISSLPKVIHNRIIFCPPIIQIKQFERYRFTAKIEEGRSNDSLRIFDGAFKIRHLFIKGVMCVYQSLR